MGTAVEEEFEKTTEICAQCEDELLIEEDVIVVQVMRPEISNGHPHLVPMLDENGDFLFQHYFLHFKCWEEITESLKEEIEDSPPVPDEFALLPCEGCGSDIRECEPVLTVSVAELIHSKRKPSGEAGLTMVVTEAPNVFCLWCLTMINEYWLTFWEEGVSIDGECIECQHARCWRGFDCACTCHDEGEKT